MDEAGHGLVLASPPKCAVPVARVGLIARSIRRHLRCRDARSFISDGFATETACLKSLTSDSHCGCDLRFERLTQGWLTSETNLKRQRGVLCPDPSLALR